MKKVLSLLLCGVLLFGIVGCGKEKIKEYEIKEEKSGVIVITDDKNVNDDTKVRVKEDKTDYSSINENINKYIAYDISLSNDDDTISVENKSKVYLKIPDDYDKKKLVVYYILNNEIKETFNVKVVDKNKESYAMFETNHFSIYVLAELKEDVKENVKENEIEEDSKVTEEKEDDSQVNTGNNTNDNTSTNNNSSSNSNSNSNSSSTNTVNLVGNWKHDSSNTYYTFKSDYSGILYINATEETATYTFVWGFQDGNLSIKYDDSSMGSTKGKIKIYNENKIDIQPSKGLIYNRYSGEITVNKIVEKDIKLKVNYINIPNGLEVTNSNNDEETVHVRTSNESLLKNTYTVSYDLSHCTISNCIATPTYNVPSDFKLSATVISRTVSLRNKRYYRDVYFDILYVNFSSGYYDATSSKTVFKANVYAESEEELDNAKYQVYIDMKDNNAPGTWNVLAEYFASGKVNLTQEGLSEYVTVTVTEK